MQRVRLGFLLVAGVLLGTAAWAQAPSEPCRFLPQGRARGYELVSSLCRGWQRVDPRARTVEPLSVPSADLDADEQIARLEPAFTALPTDTLWLYFEGVAGQASITWNGRLLDITDHPLDDRLVALPPGLLQLGTNHLVVRMRPSGFDDQALPAPFTGLFRGVYLLRRSRVATPPRAPDAPARPGQLTARYAPWTDGLGPDIDSATAARHLLWLRAHGVQALQFVFRPSHRLRAQVEAFGLRVVSAPAERVLHFNAYPTLEAARLPFWLDQQGQPTVHFGSTWAPGVMLRERPSRAVLLLLGLVPLALLVLWRLNDPPSFAALLTWGALSRRAYEQIAKGVTLRGVPVLLISLVRLVITAALVLSLTLALRSWGRPDLLPAASGSLLGQLLRLPAGDEWRAVLLVVGGLAAWLVFKLVLVRLLGAPYRLKRLPGRLLLIQAIAAFPLILVPAAVNFTLLVADPEGATASLLLQGACGLTLTAAGLYLILMLRELQRALDTPILVNLLYLCALEILPWLWLARGF